MQRFTIFILLSMIGLNCSPAKKTQRNETIGGSAIDYSKIAIITSPSEVSFIFDQEKISELSAENLEQIEALLILCIKDYNIEAEEAYNIVNTTTTGPALNKRKFIIDLKEYYRQYVPVLNEQGEIEVWINCLCDVTNTDWTKGIIIVFDGGNCFFNVKINLTKKQCYDLRVNGSA